MPWYAYPLLFLSGVLLANGVPHFGHGIAGRKFPTPFAKPPGVGESPPLVNVLWGAANFFIGGVLLARHWPRGNATLIGWGLLAAGFIASAVFLARHFSGVSNRRG